MTAPTSTTSADVPSNVDDGRYGPRTSRWARSKTRKALLVVGAAVFASFWVWALFFASKEAVNKIGDEAWGARAETICAEYDPQIRAVGARTDADLTIRADLVDESTDLLSVMLDEIVAVQPTDPKGQAIVPDWEADYRTLLDDRYNYADELRAGKNVPFTETAVNGVPITERIETFAGDNAMPTCSPPRGSII